MAGNNPYIRKGKIFTESNCLFYMLKSRMMKERAHDKGSGWLENNEHERMIPMQIVEKYTEYSESDLKWQKTEQMMWNTDLRKLKVIE